VYGDAQTDEVPLISVGAKNPNNRSIALFSNAGEWITAHRPGAALVSTFPADMNGPFGPVAAQLVPGDGMRATIDPDDFRFGSDGGFGTWSGTSFAAPLMAGELAQALVDGGDLDLTGVADCVTRGWSAVANCVGMSRP
jgi:subtilisin family serine protease